MSLPPRTAPPSPPEAGASGTARWLNLVTTTVLGAVALVVVAAAMPSLLRAGVSAAEEPQALPPPLRGHHPTLVPRSHPPHAFPRGDDADDGPIVPRPEVISPNDPRSPALSPNDPRAAAPRLPRQDRDDDDEPGLGLKSGVTLKPLLLRDRHTGTVVHEVKAGEPVSILRDDSEWVLVVHKTKDDLVTGWAKRGELLLR
jgi:hypothetical protein